MSAKLNAASTEIQPIAVRAISEQVIEHFGLIAEVQQIYLEVDKQTVIYWIFTTESEHDPMLMRRLINAETVIKDTFRDTTIDFQYIPLLFCPEPRECLAQSALTIYQRGN